ncbi:MAG: ribonuclease HII [Rhodanobacteraceae bacterium]
MTASAVMPSTVATIPQPGVNPIGEVAGLDEAGCGPLAGPVVVAAVILDPSRHITGLADSKVLSSSRREVLAGEIRAMSLAFSVIIVDVVEIDRLNILRARLAGMSRALAALRIRPTLALVDGNRLPPDLPCGARAIVAGDATEPAISAASILAKSTRDRLMRELDRVYPGYGFARHKGYPTPQHLAALTVLGPCPIHRMTFAPVRRFANGSLF